MWGKSAEALVQHLTKGKQVLVKGFMKQERWEDATGAKKSMVVLQCEKLQFLSSGTSTRSDDPPETRQAPPRRPESEYDDDIPF
jgi:single-stranded DNA-binding protein